MNASIEQTGAVERRSLGRRTASVAARGVLATWRLALLVLFIIGGAAVGGFLNFVHEVQSLPERSAADAPAGDAVVVLTGGPRRIDAGLELLGAAKGTRLLISGVNPVTSAGAIQRTSHSTWSSPTARKRRALCVRRLLAFCTVVPASTLASQAPTMAPSVGVAASS